MRRKLLVSALALILLVNGLVLAGVAWNRGETEAVLRLTERELPVAWRGGSSSENSGIALRLQTATLPEYDWLDAAKLQALGFDPAAYYVDAARVKNPVARKGYVVLEFDGPAWQQLVQEKERKVEELPARIAAGEATAKELEQARKSLRHMQTEASRLVPIDAGPDADALRGQYPERERFLIAPAAFDARSYYRRKGEPEPMRGYLRGILVDAIHLPVEFHEGLASAKRSGTHRPRYQVAVDYGRRLEPWVVQLVPLTLGLEN